MLRDAISTDVQMDHSLTELERLHQFNQPLVSKSILAQIQMDNALIDLQDLCHFLRKSHSQCQITQLNFSIHAVPVQVRYKSCHSRFFLIELTFIHFLQFLPVSNFSTISHIGVSSVKKPVNLLFCENEIVHLFYAENVAFDT